MAVKLQDAEVTVKLDIPEDRPDSSVEDRRKDDGKDDIDKERRRRREKDRRDERTGNPAATAAVASRLKGAAIKAAAIAAAVVGALEIGEKVGPSLKGIRDALYGRDTGGKANELSRGITDVKAEVLVLRQALNILIQSQKANILLGGQPQFEGAGEAFMQEQAILRENRRLAGAVDRVRRNAYGRAFGAWTRSTLAGRKDGMNSMERMVDRFKKGTYK